MGFKKSMNKTGKKARKGAKKVATGTTKGAVAGGKASTTGGKVLKNVAPAVGAAYTARTGDARGGAIISGDVRATGQTMVHGGRALTNLGRVGREATRNSKSNTKEKRRSRLEKAGKQGGKALDRASRITFI